jgi:NAD(P)-dependent dehydrogenase (short-subunit alcohol dehydrogenase family)
MPMDREREEQPLAGKIIVVTGASSGVGYAMVRRLVLTEGARVAAVGRRRMFRVEALARQILEQFGEDRLLPITTDLSAPGQAQLMADQVIEKFQQIDGFLHAINRSLKLTALEVNDQEFDMTMQVNVKSALYAVQAIAPLLRGQRSGAIIIYNPTPLPTPIFAASEAVYAAAAQALSALACGWKRQIEPYGIQVREVAPMPLADPMNGDMCAHDELILSALRECLSKQRSALPALGTPADWALNARHPVVLSRLGGLSLTQFSQAE